MDKLSLPHQKIHGMRFGQLVWNAIAHKYGPEPRKIADCLFFLDNDSLETLIDEYLTHLKQFEKEAPVEPERTDEPPF